MLLISKKLYENLVNSLNLPGSSAPVIADIRRNIVERVRASNKATKKLPPNIPNMQSLLELATDNNKSLNGLNWKNAQDFEREVMMFTKEWE